ncbi:hypothetical protein DH2020_008213 [Rehmannia glutinosa]|uniref:Tf2-1-like SH3-like domain-containing protein n=1 Tax=Rehmannia glutinosa TaxID=99300 RepID=A0ABR0U0D4_REHGL
MLRACVLDFGGGWERHLPLIEFTYNNSYQSTIGMAPFEAIEKIRERIKVAQDRQKSYVDPKRKELQFMVGEKVFLRVSPTEGIFRFGKRGKLKPRYVGPYEISERVGRVAYMPYPSHVVNYETIELDRQLSYEEKPVAVLDRKVHKLRNRYVELIKVQWSGHSQEEATWDVRRIF